ncbi:AraC family transcriptional regulator [Belliella sp. R4-6]|uniref:AraC family transcriptional regulator n=1 Tax=Belliella alkalica TaxID=1730871 RepID=A0ABS9VFW7_9BACT|nr:helix-turn-helix transcriptional regulator [Belliella alkalica]MCH7415059.1 AraC family transcriptional regulator [Belliella alkalica]
MKSVFPILNIDQFPAERNGEFYANDIRSHIDLHHHHISKPHKHDFYLTVIFTEGSGFHEIDFNSYKVTAGSVFLLKPGQTHFWDLSDDISGYVILHSKLFFDLNYSKRSIDNFPFFYSVQNDPSIYLDLENMEEVVQIFRAIKHEYDSDKIFKHQKIGSLTDLLYIALSRVYQSKISVSGHHSGIQLEQLRKLESLIDQYYLSEKSAAFYAERMNISSRHLNRIIQNLLGKTTTDLILERVMLEAQRLLSASKMTVSELSGFLGYEDQSYFSRLFKNRLGISPTEFSKRY